MRGTARLGTLRLWVSPADHPRWTRPALLAVTALAAAGHAWGIGNVMLEPFYGAAARSMSESWHNFVFGAFDPWGTVTVDKLPGALSEDHRAATRARPGSATSVSAAKR